MVVVGGSPPLTGHTAAALGRSRGDSEGMGAYPAAMALGGGLESEEELL